MTTGERTNSRSRRDGASARDHELRDRGRQREVLRRRQGELPVSPRGARSTLRIVFLVSAHNGLSQRMWIALTERGHDVNVAVVESAAEMEEAVARHDPQLIVCPFLKKMIPESIWRTRRCLVVHPGPPGDRGPSSLDWAIELGVPDWGVTVLEANGEYDAGSVLATRRFRLRETATKTSLYRHEVRRMATEAVLEAVDALAGGRQLSRLDAASATEQARPLMAQKARAIDWTSDPSEVVLRKLRAGAGAPGVLDVVAGIEFHLFGGCPERVLRGSPGEIIARRSGAICRATKDGAVWITQLKRRDQPGQRFCKLPSTRALALAGVELSVPEVAVPLDGGPSHEGTYRDIAYEQRGEVGYLHFDFYNGAMSTQQCQRLLDAFVFAREQLDTRVIVLMGGRDYFSNGIHLNMIEAADDPAAESWRNLNAINDVVREIITTGSHIVISALAGDAGAGGVPLALAADHVVARADVVLNPYYRHMGGLYGSEYWTYLLPRRIGEKTAEALVNPPFLPLGAAQATRIGLLDGAFGATVEEFHRRTRALGERLAAEADFKLRLEHKRWRRAHDESVKPLQTYRDEELERSFDCFFGPDASYHDARRRFVYKLRTPTHEPAAALR
jgi:putative two-component system protein, hydrogenase maturation factor HypX/HoxX